MPSDKEIKEKFRTIVYKDPNRYYPLAALKDFNFIKKSCKLCKRIFWSLSSSPTCGDPTCIGGFKFFGKKRSKRLNYADVWNEFARIHKALGYTPIKRYSVISRWNPTTDFVIASIAAFQPYVVRGEVDPPANPLVIPQPCLRFSDIDSVGLSGHFSLFCMMGEHQFRKPQEYDMNQYFVDHLTWLQKGMGIKPEELYIHGDAWAGGMDVGSAVEFFVDGLELSNQVYMQYEFTGGMFKELPIKVLDMGQGQERAAWFLKGDGMSYDVTFPEVMKKLCAATGLKPDSTMQKKFLPYASLLNVDEVEDIQKAWKTVARNIGASLQGLRDTLLPSAALYSIADHSRALLVALNDGALPSNTGGYYNLRVILRRALSFIDQYQWKIDLRDLVQWHAKELKPLFPELEENLENVNKILENEISKYRATKQKSRQIISGLIQQHEKIDDKMLLTLYDSQGISPELVREEALKLKKKIEIPDDFYKKVAELHDKTEDKFQTHKKDVIDFGDVPATKVLYYDDYKTTEFTARIIKQAGRYILLDNTYFYPTSGGQLHDKGTIHGVEVVDVFKQGNVIVHVLGSEQALPRGKELKCVIDRERRMQLAQHHTTAHILNAAARRILGSHINQASAHKDIDKGRLDITHYKSLTEEETRKIEEEANKIVRQGIPMEKRLVERGKAEKEYGVGIYQGGVVPGKQLRIVHIPGVDVEACGGTHLDNTKEAGQIRILKTAKISDSIVRIEYASGKAAQQLGKGEKELADELSKILHVDKSLIIGRVEELFELWKQKVKKKKDIKPVLSSTKKEYIDDEDVLHRAASILKTQPEHVVKTVKRFLDDIQSK